MRKNLKKLLWTGVVAGAATAVIVATVPASAESTDDGGDTSKSYEQQAIEMKLDNAWVDPQAELQFGAEPLDAVTAAAETAAGDAPCEISPEAAVAVSLAPTWPEVSSTDGEPPSPMTLSRYDTQPELGDPEGRAEGLWFHPGIGMWQLDSAGLGNVYTAGTAIDVETSAEGMVPFIVNKYCDALNGGADEAGARADAWTDWNACSEGACEDVYQRALENVTPVDEVDRYGGGEMRECEVGEETVECLFVDPAAAQGADWWAQPDGGASPLTAPFYVYQTGEGDDATEVRLWLADDSGADTDVQATRAFGTNARESLEWGEPGAALCDVTEGRGAC